MILKIGGAITRALVLSWLCIGSAVFAADKLSAGDTPPPSLGVTRDGQIIETTQYPGKVLVVTFWASWCGPCMRELPLLEGIQQAGGKEKIQVVAVNIEDRERFKMVSRRLASLTLTLSHDYNKGSSAAYGVHGIPHLIIIGRDGKVIRVHRGYSDAGIDSIIAEINSALAAG